MERWRGRVALVTGASVGIGRNIAITLLSHGVNVVACARRIDAVNAIKDEMKGDNVGEFLAVKCDVSKEEEILAMFDQIKSRFGGVDLCINNAGYGIKGNLREGRTSDWSGMLKVNVLGLSICTREALKSMKERSVDDGHIIHISSMVAHVVFPGAAMYSATKHAVRALTEGLRQELLAEKSGIRVTEICPGVVKTEFVEVILGDKDQAKELLASSNFLTVKDVTDAVIYTLSAPKHVQVHDVMMWPIRQPESD